MKPLKLFFCIAASLMIISKSYAGVDYDTLYATQNLEAALIVWKTSTEINIENYVIERSLDSETFENIGMISGDGTTTDPNTYTYNDFNVLAGQTYYYRLRAIFFDGAQHVSDVFSLKVVSTTSAFDEERASFSMYPNPSSEAISISIDNPDRADYSISIFNNSGELVKTIVNIQSEFVAIARGSLADGLYILRIEMEGKTIVAEKLILQ